MFSKVIILSLYDQINPKKVAECCSFNKLMFYVTALALGMLLKARRRKKLTGWPDFFAIRWERV